MMRYFIFIFILVQFTNCKKDKESVISGSLKEDATKALVSSLENATEWEKVHAAEYLLHLGHTTNIRKIFLSEQRNYGKELFYRIGIWRVLYQVSSNDENKNQWLDSIESVFKNPASVDRIHSAETLAKLKVSPTSFSNFSPDTILQSQHNDLWLFTYWATAYTSNEDMLYIKNKLTTIVLGNIESDTIQNYALYALFKMKNVDPKNWNLLFDKLEADSNNQYLTSCVLMNTPMNSIEEERVILQKEKIEKIIIKNKTENHALILDSYQQIGTAADIDFLASIMNSKNEYHNENKIAAANAILNIDE